MNQQSETPPDPTEAPAEPQHEKHVLNRHKRRKREKLLKKMGINPENFKGNLVINGEKL
jgi:hypothetical protein